MGVAYQPGMWLGDAPEVRLKAEPPFFAAAINWRERAILLGECKWGMEEVGRSVIRELVERKTPQVHRALADQGTDWTVHYAFFARTGFTEAARQEAHEHQALLVNLAVLGEGLRPRA